MVELTKLVESLGSILTLLTSSGWDAELIVEFWAARGDCGASVVATKLAKSLSEFEELIVEFGIMSRPVWKNII